MAETKALTCVFVFAYAKSRFSHDAAHIVLDMFALLKTSVSDVPHCFYRGYIYFNGRRFPALCEQYTTVSSEKQMAQMRCSASAVPQLRLHLEI